MEITTSLKAEFIRKMYTEGIRRTIRSLEKKGIKISHGLSELEGSDSYLFMANDIQDAFKVVTELTTIELPIKGEQIPFEIALTIRDIENEDIIDLKTGDEIINFLKENILSAYKYYYKKTNKGIGIKNTFVVHDQRFHDSLSPYDQKFCQNIEWKREGRLFSFYVLSLDRVYERYRFFEFLEMIGLSKSAIYENLYDIYVPPNEYQPIQDNLKNNKSVIITGSPEYGKTFTAIRILWEYYKKGYKPIYLSQERIQNKRIISDLRAHVKDLKNTVIYLEDPIGKVKYEPNSDFEQNIVDIILTSLPYLDSYLVITMREEIFHESHIIGGGNYNEYVKTLNMGNRSYDAQKRKEILLNWAIQKDCKWLQREELKREIMELMTSDIILPTPLNIHNFAAVTSKLEVLTNREYLLKILKDQSKRTAEIFADDIKKMTDNKVLFLCFPFISGGFSKEFVKSKYLQLVPSSTDEYLFEKVCFFFRDKVEFETNIRFSHPSYSEAVRYLLVDDNNIPTQINLQVFCKVLDALLKDENSVGAAAAAILRFYDKLPSDFGNTLFIVIEKNEVARDLAFAIWIDFNEIPSIPRNQILTMLTKRSTIEPDVIDTLLRYYEALPSDLKNLVFELGNSNDINTLSELADRIIYYYDVIPDNIRDLLFKLVAEDDVADYIVIPLLSHFDRLPQSVQNLVYDFAQRENVAPTLALSISGKYNNLPVDVQKLLFALAERDESVAYVIHGITANYNNLPVDVQKLLFALAERDDTAKHVARLVLKYYNNVDNSVQQLIPSLAKRRDLTKYVAAYMVDSYDQLPKPIQHLFFELINNEEVAGYVGTRIALNFGKVSETIQHLLTKLIENPQTRLSISSLELIPSVKLDKRVQELLQSSNHQ